MIVRNLAEANQTNRRIVSPDGNWESTRLLLKDDNMGFSFHITTIYKNADFQMHYQNHLESVYCMSGLDKHDKHILRATEEMTMACVFNPPLNGKEVHNKEGAYELAADTI